MKRILIAAGLVGMLVPAVASAELEYSIVDVGFTSKISRGINANFTEYIFGLSKSVSKRIFLGASYQAGTLPATAAYRDTKVGSATLSAGYHTPLNETTDIVVVGHISQGSDLVPGSNESANSSNLGAGVRSEFPHGLEGSVFAYYSNTSGAAYSSNDTYVNAQFGFDFTPSIQMYGGIDLWRSDQTLSFGLRIFY
jgi:hypothetical protein